MLVAMGGRRSKEDGNDGVEISGSGSYGFDVGVAVG
jgi:hypothetical protein